HCPRHRPVDDLGGLHVQDVRQVHHVVQLCHHQLTGLDLLEPSARLADAFRGHLLGETQAHPVGADPSTQPAIPERRRFRRRGTPAPSPNSTRGLPRAAPPPHQFPSSYFRHPPPPCI